MIRKKKDFYGMVDFRDPIFSSLFVGFDGLFKNMAEMSAGSKSLPSYPPYNVLQDGDDYVIEIALAGIKKKDIDITSQENTLTVSYESSEDEGDNKLIRSWGEPKKGKSYKEHWQIAEELNMVNTEKSVRIAKSRFATLFNQGARLERSLINFMLDTHIDKHKYIEVFPPFLVSSNSPTTPVEKGRILSLDTFNKEETSSISFSESFFPFLPVAAFAFPALTIKTFGSAIFLFIFSKHISTGADLNLFEVNKPDQIASFSSFTIEVSNLVPYFVLEDAQPIFISFNIIFFSFSY